MPELDCFRRKSARGEELKFILLGIVLLHASNIGGHQADGCIQDAFVQRFEIAFLNQQRADFLQAKRGVKFDMRLVEHAGDHVCGSGS